VFFGENDFYHGVLPFWKANLDILQLNMLNNKQYLFTLANPEMYLKKNDFSKSDLEYYYNLPIKLFHDSIMSDVLLNEEIKLLYFKKDVHWKDYICKDVISDSISSCFGDCFIILK